MFRMTSDIRIGKYKVKPTAVKWRDAVDSFRSTATVSMSRRLVMRDRTSAKDSIDLPIKPGDAVNIKLGYDGVNRERFSGFVKRIILGKTIEIECEGYALQLDRIYLNKSYKSTTLKQILTDLIAGTDIVLSRNCEDVVIKNVTFSHAPGAKVLEWAQKELLCTASFYGNELYVGILKYGKPGKGLKLSFGYNTVEDAALKPTALTTIQAVNVRLKTKNGSVKSYGEEAESRKYDNVKEFNIRYGLPWAFHQKLIDELARQTAQVKFSGNITLFAEPAVSKGDIVNIEDKRHGTRDGRYMVNTVSGSYGSGGGRQVISLTRIENYLWK